MKAEVSKQLAIEMQSNVDAILEGWFENHFSDQFQRQWKIAGTENINQEQLLITYLGPLLRLLIEYLKTGRQVYLYAYLDERLRYAPHRESPEVRAAFFKILLEKNIQTILNNCASQMLSQTEIINLLKRVHAPLTKIEKKNNITMLALGDCLMNEIRVFLPHISSDKDIYLDMRCIYFSARLGKGLDLIEISNFINSNKVDLIAISILSYDALPLYSMLLKECDALSREVIDEKINMITNIIADLLNELRELTDTTFLLHNTSGLPLDRYRKHIPFLPVFSSAKKYVVQSINRNISQLVSSVNNMILINEYGIAKKHGIRNCAKEVFPRRIIQQGMLHTGKLGYFICEHYMNNITSYNRLYKCKALLLDFDNTLWQGVMADGDVIHYVDRQILLKKLKQAGILLISISKNTEENIRWDEMQLSKDDFVLHKINWDLKVKSIADAVDELNIGMDSIVFVDDNPVEMDLVVNEFSDITVLDANDKNTWADLELMMKFPNTKETEESRKRTEMYRQAFERKKSLQKKEYDYPKMMATLKLKSQFRQANPSDLDRIFELVNRTNQFNTTTIRYRKDDLKEMMKNENFRIFTATLEDKFGNLGIVLVVILELKDDTAFINSFIMSCRAMGFALENQILNLLMDKSLHGKGSLIGVYRETDRNTPCSSLYKNNHFTKINDEEWLCSIKDNCERDSIDWIEMI